MPQICFDESRFSFPPVETADEEGLLLIGGQVTADRVVEAYRKGIFPWYSDDALPLWFSPNPRFVLFPDELRVSKSMHAVLSKELFSFRTNTAFSEVLGSCATTPRNGQEGTWITPAIETVYTQLHHRGLAHSAEAWKEDRLVGGLYGLRIGRVFFGESMFSRESNASKFAFIRYVQQLKAEGVELIDCQVYTEHLESLGARLIAREEYLERLKQLL